MKKIQALILLSLFITTIVPVNAETYYIDPDAGNDANNGTSTATPWRTLPGSVDSTTGNFITHSTFVPNSVKFPRGTVFEVKAGTIISVADGVAQIYLDKQNFADSNFDGSGVNNYDDYVFKRSTTWGSGNITVDAAGFFQSPNPNNLFRKAAFQTRGVSGVTIDGTTATGGGFTFINSSNCAVELNSSATAGPITSYGKVYSCLFSNNGTYNSTVTWTNVASADQHGASFAHLKNEACDNFIASNNICLSGPNFASINHCINGIGIGIEQSFFHTLSNITVCNNTISNLLCDTSNNDSGIGIKHINCDNIKLYSNYVFQCGKGTDSGNKTNGVYTQSIHIYNNIFASNSVAGVGCSGPLNPSVAKTIVYVANNIVWSNNGAGIRMYGAPMDSYIVHNTCAFDGNSGNNVSYAAGSIQVYSDSSTDPTKKRRDYIYNNICFWGQEASITVSSYRTTYDYSLFSDYNTYVRDAVALPPFVQWAALSAGDTVTYNYGANPAFNQGGQGNWYNHYNINGTTPPSVGIGHFHCDLNSFVVLNGAGDNLSGVFFTTTNNNLTTPFKTATVRAGVNIAPQPWFQPYMGKDFSGKVRAAYDIGAYELTVQGVALPVYSIIRSDGTVKVHSF